MRGGPGAACASAAISAPESSVLRSVPASDRMRRLTIHQPACFARASAACSATVGARAAVPTRPSGSARALQRLRCTRSAAARGHPFSASSPAAVRSHRGAAARLRRRRSGARTRAAGSAIRSERARPADARGHGRCRGVGRGGRRRAGGRRRNSGRDHAERRGRRRRRPRGGGAAAPTWRQLYAHALQQAPFTGFGIMDNAIMIVAATTSTSSSA